MKNLHFLLLVAAVAITACTGQSRQETGAVAAPQTAETAAEAPVAQTNDSSPIATTVPTETPPTAVLPVLGPAPAWNNEVWINSEPLPLEELRGKVVLLEFWTFG